MKAEDIKALAVLSRLEVSDAELEPLARDFDAILGYIDQIKKVNAGSSKEEHIVETSFTKNVMREDVEVHESGAFTEALVAAAPARQGNYIKVKNIF